MRRFLLALGLTATAAMIPSVAFSQDESGDDQPSYTVNFKDTDIQEVIKFVAEATGKTIIIDPRVKGRIKVISQTTVRQDDLFELFLSILEVHDYTAVEVEGVVRVLPLKDARSSPVPVRGYKKRPNETTGYVTEVIQLRNIEAAKVLPVLRPLVPQHSHLSSYTESNVIVVSDTAPNIARLRNILQRIDTAALPTTEVVPLRYADSEELVATLTQLNRGDKQSTTPANKLQIVADKRNNAILLSGEDMQRKRTKELILKLDRPPQQLGNVRVIYLNYADAKDAAAVLSKVAQNMQKMQPSGSNGEQSAVTVEADEDTNALLLTGSGDMLNSLETIIDRLDIKRAQVLVEAIIVEINANAGESLGVEWLFGNEDKGAFGASSSGNGRLGGVGQGALQGGDEGLASIAAALAGNVGQALAGVGTSGSENFVLLLTALQTNNEANILSTPSLVTMDNQEASISVGQSVPFRTGSFSSTGNGGGGVTNPFTTIQRQDVGISLTVTPHVNENGKILLDISQEVSSLSGAAPENSADLITNQSKIETQILSSDGEIVVLGGLMKEDVQDVDSRVPVLGSIPFLGNFFKSQSTTVTKNNLMVFIRSKIVTDDETMRGATAEKYASIRELQLDKYDRGLNLKSRKYVPILPELEPAAKKALEDAMKSTSFDQLPDSAAVESE